MIALISYCMMTKPENLYSVFSRWCHGEVVRAIASGLLCHGSEFGSVMAVLMTAAVFSSPPGKF
jgi:hypothetical protein